MNSLERAILYNGQGRAVQLVVVLGSSHCSSDKPVTVCLLTFCGGVVLGERQPRQAVCAVAAAEVVVAVDVVVVARRAV